MKTAKEIFFAYDGNHCFMANDGIYDHYKSFEISKAQENIWLQEIKNNKFNKLYSSTDIKFDFVKACLAVGQSKQFNQMNQLYDFLISDKPKSLPVSSRLYMCSTFADLIRNSQNDKIKNKFAKKLMSFIDEVATETNEPNDLERARKIKERVK